jgi:hypothetical protein
VRKIFGGFAVASVGDFPHALFLVAFLTFHDAYFFCVVKKKEISI